MGHQTSASDLPRGGEKLDLGRLSGVRLALLGIAGLGLVGSIAMFYLKTASFAYSWLYAFGYFFTIGVGGLFWLLLHHASNSGWGIVVRRIMEQVANMLPWVGLIGLPLLFPGIRENLWDWMRAIDHAHGSREALKASDPLLYAKYPFLNYWGYGILPGFLLRFPIYFLLLGFGAWALRRYSLRQDATGEVRPTLSARRFSCGWLPVFAVCVTFAAVDWFMTLNYAWFSTMWGVYVFAGSALSSMAFIIITVTLLKRAGYLQFVNSEHFHIKGKLMHAFVIFWAYITFSQFFLIWYANITEETSYYLIRNTGNWNTGAIITYLVCHFVIPFVLLLPAWMKRNPVYLSGMACWILFAHALDLYFIIIPERGPSIADMPTVPGAFWGDILAFVTVGAIFVFLFITTLGRHSLYACGDPRLHESLNIHS